MQIGFGAPVAGAWATPGYLTAFARQAEAAGYASLWGFQRLLVPEGSPMEPVYRSVLDPMVALGFAAAGADEVSSFSGEFYTVPAGRQDPRPARKPGPGASPTAGSPLAGPT